jgi:hypothetical protein
MSSVGGVSGGLPADLMLMMDELARETRRDHIDQSRQRADEALHQGLQEAEEMREKAQDIAHGAIVHGAFTAASGAVQLGAAMNTNTNLAGDATVNQKANFDAHNQKMGGLGAFGGTLGQVGNVGKEGYDAAVAHDESQAREAAARSEAAQRNADAEQSAADEAKNLSEKAREMYNQISSLEHASVMAALSQKA